MNSSEFDSVKEEKAAAMRRYNGNRIFRNSFRSAMVLVFLSWAFTRLPLIKETASNYLSFLNHPFYVFVILNVTLLLVYHLSTTKDTVTTNNNHQKEFNLYEQYISLSAHWRKTTEEDKEKQLVVSPENLDYNKQLVCYENIAEENPVFDLTVVGEEKRNLVRSRSENCGREILSMMKNKKKKKGKELRRLKTTVGSKSMEDMNNEEFRLTVESFIAHTKKILMDENITLLSED